MHYESESGRSVRNPTEQRLSDLLGGLDGRRNSYAILTAPDGSYVQAGGGPARFIVEVREISANAAFRHVRAVGSGRTPGTVEEVLVGGAALQPAGAGA